MSLLGNLVTYYQTNDAAADLRATLGSGFFADVLPDTIPFPNVVLAETARSVQEIAKGLVQWIETVTVAFDVYGASRDVVESVLYGLEDVFCSPGSQLPDDSHRHHLATIPGNRMQSIDSLDAGQQGDVWHGVLELDFKLQKLTA